MFMNFPFDYFSKAIIPMEMETVGGDTIPEIHQKSEILILNPLN